MLSSKFFALGLALFGSSFATVAFAQSADTASSDLVARELESFSANLAARREFLVTRSDEHFEDRDLLELGIKARSTDNEDDELEERSFDDSDELFARDVSDVINLDEGPDRGYPEATLAEHLASREVHDEELEEELEERSFDDGEELVLREVLDERSLDDRELVARDFDDELVARDVSEVIGLEGPERGYPEATLAEHLASRELHDDELEARSFDDGEELVLREVLDERSLDDEELVARDLDERSFEDDELVAREFRQDFEERSLEDENDDQI